LLKAIQNLGNKHPHVRTRAVADIAGALTAHGRKEDEEVRIAVRCLAEHVHDPDEKTATEACACLVIPGAASASAFPELAKACLDPRPVVSMQAATALVKLVRLSPTTRRRAVQVLPILVSGLPAMHADVVTQFATILRLLEDDAEATIGQLVQEHLQAEPQGLVAQMREKVTGHYRKRRQRCFELLGKVGPFAEPAVPALKEFLKSDDPWLQQQAKSSLIRILRSAEE
jgi:hypothetical protein